MLAARSILFAFLLIALHSNLYAQEKPGTAQNKIPDSLRSPLKDTDGDGVNDTEDKCINEKGPATNYGCPIIPGTAIGCGLKRYIYFSPGSLKLSTASVKQLNMLVEVLNENPGLYATFVGYTDSLDRTKVKLSVARAKAAKLYLLKAGISKGLIEYKVLSEKKLKDEGPLKQVRNRIEITVAYREN